MEAQPLAHEPQDESGSPIIFSKTLAPLPQPSHLSHLSAPHIEHLPSNSLNQPDLDLSRDLKQVDLWPSHLSHLSAPHGGSKVDLWPSRDLKNVDLWPSSSEAIGSDGGNSRFGGESVQQPTLSPPAAEPPPLPPAPPPAPFLLPVKPPTLPPLETSSNPYKPPLEPPSTILPPPPPVTASTISSSTTPQTIPLQPIPRQYLPPLPSPPPPPPATLSFLDAYLDNLISTEIDKPLKPKEDKSDPLPEDDPLNEIFTTEVSRTEDNASRGLDHTESSTPGLGGGLLPLGGLPPRHPGQIQEVPHKVPYPPHYKRNDSVDSFASHDRSVAAAAGGGGGGGQGVGGGIHLPRVSSLMSESGQQFTALQQHIEELTEDKMTLQRGLNRQQQMAEELSRENQMLTEQYNVQARTVESLQKKIQRYEDELEAQVLSLEGLSSERDTARTLAQEASSRATLIAAVAVELEQKLLAEKVREIKGEGEGDPDDHDELSHYTKSEMLLSITQSLRLRAESSAASATSSTSRLEKQVQSLKRELDEARGEVERSVVEKRALAVRAKQLESRLQGAIDDGYKVKPMESTTPFPPPPAIQSDSGQSTAPESSRGEKRAVAHRPETREVEVQCVIIEPPADPTPSPEEEAIRPPEPVPSSVATAGDKVAANVEQEVEVELEMKKGDATSLVLADQATSLLARLNAKKLPSATQPSTTSLPPSTKDAISLIVRWLPMGPVGGSDPVAAVVEEEMRAVHSIHELMEEYEVAMGELVRGLEGCRERESYFKAESQGLRAQLEKLKGIVVDLPLGGDSPTRSLASPLQSFIDSTPLSMVTNRQSVMMSHVGMDGMSHVGGLGSRSSEDFVFQTPDQRKSHSYVPRHTSTDTPSRADLTRADLTRTDLTRTDLTRDDPPALALPFSDQDENNAPPSPKRVGWLGYILGSSPNPQAKKRMRG